METPVIVGAGLAGLSAALTFARAGQPCALVSVQPSERAQSVLAEGGINAALDLMGEDDSPEQHLADTLAGGRDLADPVAVRRLCEGAPDVVRDLIGLGVPFNTEGGRMVQRYFGGQKKARTAYARSSTGKVLVSALVDAVRRHEAEGLVERLSFHELVGLRRAGGGVSGATLRDARTGGFVVLCGPVVLCSGGWAALFGGVTTGSAVNTGDVTALALDAGAELANLEFVQYHPTTVMIAGKRMLVSEAARGEGGRLMTLRDGAPWYFMEELHPELGNLSPRDVVSREEARVLADPRCDGVYLDLRGLSRAVWERRLPDLREECVHYLGLDPARELLPVEPGIHYCMGGVLVDAEHRASLPGLYAAGECACQYHGANRLGGNSLLGAVFGGRVAAGTVLADARAGRLSEEAGPRGLDEEEAEPPSGQVPPAPSAALSAALAEGLGILRDEDGLRCAAESLDGQLAAMSSPLERRRVQLARAAIACARARRESRGAHWRSDFPQEREEFRRASVVRLADGAPQVTFREAGQGGEGR